MNENGYYNFAKMALRQIALERSLKLLWGYNEGPRPF